MFINHFAGIRADLDRTLVAAYVAELAEQFSVEGKKNLPLFELLTDFLGFMSAAESRRWRSGSSSCGC